MLRTLISSLLWRVRGGLRIEDKKIPLNKIWFALFIGVYCHIQGKGFEISINSAIATYVSYQLYGWGKYIGALVSGSLDVKEKECEIIDDLLDDVKFLTDRPKLYGFVGTTITGLMITYLMGLGMVDFWYGFVGAGMGVCYWLGSKFEKLIPLGKSGWNWGEWIFGAWLGFWL